MSGLITSRLNTIWTEFLAEGTWYIGLHTTQPNPAGAGAVEPTASEYARQAVTFGTPANGIVRNLAAVTFPTPVTSGGYGVIRGAGLYSSADPVAAPNPQAILEFPSGDFSMPVGYNRSLGVGYITLELRSMALQGG